jgi:hypothetical protein
MLRASAKAVGQPVDAVNAVNGEEVELGVPHGPLLVGLVNAVLGEDLHVLDPAHVANAANTDRAGDIGEIPGAVGVGQAVERARSRLAEAAGPAAVSEAVAVIANFEMMTRVADSTGARLPPERLGSTQNERERLGVDRFTSAR